MKQFFYSNGKLLISGEYLVLDGAKALAFPTKFGQSLEVETIKEPSIFWKSLDEKGNVWLDIVIEISEIISPQKNNTRKDIRETTQLISILKEAQKLNPKFLTNNTGFVVTTKLDFPRNWGLGSSSTLINNIANWANVDAFLLLKNTFGGSGYDIASAQNNVPILYSIKENKSHVEALSLNWKFTESLFFVHLNKKQDSRDAITSYQTQKAVASLYKDKITQITTELINCSDLPEFEKLITQHEKIISEIIQQKTIKETLFKDYFGSIKSLGAWGGDFILATGSKNNWNYFKDKGFTTILSFQEMIK